MTAYDSNQDLDARLREAFLPPDDVAAVARDAAARAIAHREVRPRGFAAMPPWARGILATAALFLMGFSPLWAPEGEPLPLWTDDTDDQVASVDDPYRWERCSDSRLDAIARELFPIDLVGCSDLGPLPFEQLRPAQPMVCQVASEDATWRPLPGIDGLAWLSEPLLRLGTPRPTDDGGYQLMAEHGGQRAVLLIHPRAAAPSFGAGADGRLRIHRKEVAGYVVHELGASTEPFFLARIDQEQ
ncbi:MAG: hypothetical protein O2816_02720 [Planctomycetota bacterium]|nr:hypothetical protein [Planctomycetota bacterium]